MENLPRKTNKLLIMSKLRGSFDSSNSLKGIAIFSVLINHYLNRNVSFDFSGFANLIIGVFFILSGYGNYFSLQRYLKDRTINLITLRSFYISRIVRIFPLFWISYIIECLIMGKTINILPLFGLATPGHYWFITSILLCYIISPLIFKFIQKNSLITLVSLFSLFLLFSSIDFIFLKQYNNLWVVQFLDTFHIYWRDFIFLPIFLFSISMFIPVYLNHWEEISDLEKNFWFFISSIFIFLFIASFKYASYLNIYRGINFTLAPIFLMLIIVIYFLYNNLSYKYLSFIGKISYPIYLFHMSLYLIIDRMLGTFGIYRDSLIELIINLSIFPLFIYMCLLIDNFGGFIYKKFR